MTDDWKRALKKASRRLARRAVARTQVDLPRAQMAAHQEGIKVEYWLDLHGVELFKATNPSEAEQKAVRQQRQLKVKAQQRLRLCAFKWTKACREAKKLDIQLAMAMTRPLTSKKVHGHPPVTITAKNFVRLFVKTAEAHAQIKKWKKEWNKAYRLTRSKLP